MSAFATQGGHKKQWRQPMNLFISTINQPTPQWMYGATFTPAPDAVWFQHAATPNLHNLHSSTIVTLWSANQTCPSAFTLLATTGSNLMLFFAHNSCNVITTFFIPRSYLSADLLVVASGSSHASSSTNHTNEPLACCSKCGFTGSPIFIQILQQWFLIYCAPRTLLA